MNPFNLIGSIAVIVARIICESDRREQQAWEEAFTTGYRVGRDDMADEMAPYLQETP